MISKNIVLIALMCASSIHATQETNWTFPDGFLIGTATSSYQVEGAWNISDKGENSWDRFVHSQTDKIVDGTNADVTCDSYHKFKEDVQLIKQMGMDFYRFSLSWSRILPTGHSNVVSKDGIRYYNDLINELIKHNITPVVTIYHWDHPQKFQDMGGWTNKAMVNWFGDYSRVVFREFGDRVKMFVTINEPQEICTHGYYTGKFAPGLTIGKDAEYLCSTNVLKAHASAYHIYKKEFKAQQNGQIGIVILANNFIGKSKGDIYSEEVAFQFRFDRYAHPIFSKTGDYPSIMKEKIQENSKFEGLEHSRLPTLSNQWIDFIKGSSDFLGLNHYTSELVEPAPKLNYTIYARDDGLLYSRDPNWPITPSEYIRIVPEGLLKVLMRVKINYGNVPVYIMENGVPDAGTLKDFQRIEYLQLYMKAMLTAIKDYGCNVKAYTFWSLLDNFEWHKGYTEKFGLFQVDFNHPNRTRTPKQSVHWITKLLKSRTILPLSNDLH